MSSLFIQSSPQPDPPEEGPAETDFVLVLSQTVYLLITCRDVTPLGLPRSVPLRSYRRLKAFWTVPVPAGALMPLTSSGSPDVALSKKDINNS